MKSKLGSTLVIGLALFMGSGCSIKGLVKKLEKEADKQADIVCECLDGDAKDECYSSSDVDYTDCQIDALKEDAKASREHLKCTLDVMKDMTKCYEDNIDCDDPQSTLTCLDKLADLEDCEELPEAVQEALAECYQDEAQN